MLLLGHWLLATDLHVEPAPGGPVAAGYGSDSNWALLDSTVAEMRRADPDPQVVILTGDFLAHHFPHDVPLAEKTMARIVRTFNAAFPHAQFIIVPGNNDDPCGDYRVTPGSAYFEHLAKMWAPLVNRGGAAPDFERAFAQYGWYAARLPIGRLRAIALDTVYWSIVYRRCSNVHPQAPQRELEWLSSTIAALPAHTRAMLVMHIPPGVDPNSTLSAHRLLVVPFWRRGPLEAFLSMLDKNGSRVAFARAGHMHRSDFRLLENVPMLIAASVSPVYRNNPSFLRLDVRADGTLQNYTQYDFDEWSGAWQAQTAFDAMFGVNAFTAASLASLHQQLRTDKTLRRQWAFMRMGAAYSDEVNGATMLTYWCSQTETGEHFVACAGLKRRLQVLPIVAGIIAAAVLALIALIAVRLSRKRAR